jgi:hypothetical protein
MTKKHMKKCTTCLAIKEYKSKSCYNSTSFLLECLPSRTQTTTNVGEDRVKYTVGWNVN